MSERDKERWIDRFRERNGRILLKIAESRLYRLIAGVIGLVLLARMLDPSAGAVTPSLLSRVPTWAWYVGIATLLPLFFQMISLQREINLKCYDPDAPEIKRMAKQWFLAGWLGAAFVVFSIAVVFLLQDYLEPIPIWLIAAPIILATFIAVTGFKRASDIRSGLWTPPAWMPPMNTNNIDNDENDAKE